MTSGPTLSSLADDLAAGRTLSRALVEACLAAIDDPAGEGARTFMRVDRERALAQADAIDRLRRHGIAPSRFAGIPISIKDLFDVAGEVTRAGSAVLEDAPPATRDATSVARLRAAGFVLVGRTNMSEFAFSGLGLNPHHGTPTSPWNRAAGRVPGGSSSGAAISVADGMAHAGLGTDTGGSCRIPAAFSGLVGLKPTAARVPLDGALPLAPSLDSIGPIARSVACCAAVDAVLSREGTGEIATIGLSGLRLAAPRTFVLDGMDEAVSAAYGRALSRLSEAGAHVVEIDLPAFAEVADINRKGGFAAAESYAWHRPILAERPEGYDPRIRSRIERGAGMSAADYLDLLAGRRRFVAAVEAALLAFDALVMPTVPIVPPRIADLDGDEAFGVANLLVLRNPALVNLLDGCAVSIPVGRPGEPPVGLTIAGTSGRDAAILRIAQAAESAFGQAGRA